MAADQTRKYTVSWVPGIDALDRAEWNALAGLLPSPFLEWGWLSSLEASGSIGSASGWRPSYLTVRRNGRLVGAAPFFIRMQSEGEFVFDYAWADAARRLGLRYYPKLVGMSPATPVTTFRFLTDPDEDAGRIEKIMFEATGRFCAKHGIQGCSLNYADTAWSTPRENGFLTWKHHGFLWKNEGFSSFEDYLAVFTKNQRRNIRRERESMDLQGISIRVIRGSEAPDFFFPLMYRYYEKLNLQFGPWAAKFLNRAFFDELAVRYRERCVFTAAYRGAPGSAGGAVPDEKPIGLSFLVRKGENLYGRFWGSDRFYENLYFNVCYYAPIEWCIREGIRNFDPGIGASLKARRGFQSVYSVSLHRFSEPVMQNLMASYIGGINDGEQEQIDELNRSLPFKKDHGNETQAGDGQ